MSSCWFEDTPRLVQMLSCSSKPDLCQKQYCPAFAEIFDFKSDSAASVLTWQWISNRSGAAEFWFAVPTTPLSFDSAISQAWRSSALQRQGLGGVTNNKAEFWHSGFVDMVESGQQLDDNAESWLSGVFDDMKQRIYLSSNLPPFAISLGRRLLFEFENPSKLSPLW